MPALRWAPETPLHMRRPHLCDTEAKANTRSFRFAISEGGDALEYLTYVLICFDLSVRGRTWKKISTSYYVGRYSTRLGDSSLGVLWQSLLFHIDALVSREEANDFLGAALRSLIDNYVRHFGPLHPRTLRASNMLTAVMCDRFGPQGVLGPLLGFCQDVERQLGSVSFQTIMMLIVLQGVQSAVGDFKASTATVRKVKSIVASMRPSKSSKHPGATLLFRDDSPPNLRRVSTTPTLE